MMRLPLLGLLITVGASPAAAHGIDEYVQGTLVGVSAETVVIALQLTPGQEVAPAILALLDADRDGALSAAEEEAYADRVRSDLWLAIDGRPRELRLVSSSFPPLEAMREGVGYMMLRFEADVPAGAATHSLAFQNLHQPDIGVYLVNALAPSDAGVRILSQERNPNQTLYELDFSVSPAP